VNPRLRSSLTHFRLAALYCCTYHFPHFEDFDGYSESETDSDITSGEYSDARRYSPGGGDSDAGGEDSEAESEDEHDIFHDAQDG
jgi:hypothetical protein